MKIWVEEKGFTATTPYREGVIVGDPVLFCVRPEEIMIVKEDRTIKESLRDNVFSGRLSRSLKRVRTTLSLSG